MARYSPWEMERKFFAAGNALLDLPGENIYKMAHEVAVQMEKHSPKNKPKVFGRAIIIKRPSRNTSWAGTVVIGRGFAVFAEHGSYHHPSGYPIYPKALTFKQGGFAVLRDRAVYKSEKARRGAATRRKNNAKHRGDKFFLAIPGGTHPFAKAMHPATKGSRYIQKSVDAANANSGEVMLKSVSQILGKLS